MAHFFNNRNHQQQQREQLRNAGETFYSLLPNHVHHRFCSLFNEIDANRDGTISVHELFTHVRSSRFSEADPEFATIVSRDLPFLFPLLDADGNRSLDFNECKALFLLLVVRVVCSSCTHLILSDQFYFCTNCCIPLCDGCYAATNGAYNWRCHRHSHHFESIPGVVASPELYAQTYQEFIIRQEEANHHQHQQITTFRGNINPIFRLNSQNMSNLLNILEHAVTIGNVVIVASATAGGCVVM